MICWRLPTNCLCPPDGSQHNCSGWIKLPHPLGCATDQIRCNFICTVHHRALEPHTCLRYKNFLTQWGDCSSLFLFWSGSQANESFYCVLEFNFWSMLTLLICLISSLFLISFDFQHHWLQWLLDCDSARKASKMLNQFVLSRIVQILQLTTSRQVHQSWDHSKEETRSQANPASFALLWWKKMYQHRLQTSTNRHEWKVVVSNNYLKTTGEAM